MACLLVAGSGELYAKAKPTRHEIPRKVIREDGLTLEAWTRRTKDGKGEDLVVKVSKDGKTIASFNRHLLDYDPHLEKDVQMARTKVYSCTYDAEANEIVVETCVGPQRFPYKLP